MACLQVDRLLLLQTVLYFIIVATGLATSISSALTRNEFHGLCILYGGINCTGNTLMVSGGRASICTFITAINLLICVFYAFVCGCYHAYYVHRSRVIVRIIYKLWLKTLLLGTVLVILLILVAAGTLTIGLSMWCSTLEEVAQTANKTTTCTDDDAWGDDDEWHWYTDHGSKISYSSNYYDQYYVALTSCWVSVALWIIHLMLYIRHLIRQCQLDRSYQEPFTADLFDSFT